MFESNINGKLYRLPDEEKAKLDAYVANWSSQVKQMNNGKNLPANMMAHSFTMMLIDYHERNFKEYEVVC